MQSMVAVGFRGAVQKSSYCRSIRGRKGEFAVASRNAAARDQQTVDGSYQATEQGWGGQEAYGCSLRHECPLSDAWN